MIMVHELNIFGGSLTNYQLSEALDIPIERVQDILSGDVSLGDLCPETLKKVHQLEEALFSS
ncbi:hypothetical protein [Lacicoccus alkaliphilus]